ncbi:MAG TPA: hypothetical protein VK956_15565 [Verrucomicrobium sp.]|nr:hypothetical protein [Verrucomicrobium sp.]
MKVQLLCVLAVALALTDHPSLAQDAPPIPSPGGRRLIAGSNSNAESPANHLVKTYRVSLTITGLGEKPQECSLLTSTKQVKSNLYVGGTGAGVATRLPDASNVGYRLSLSGFLEEVEGGKVRFQFSIGTSIPVPTTIRSEDKGATMTSISYTEESSNSSLLFTLGKSYEVLKVGERTYSLKIVAEEDDAKP